MGQRHVLHIFKAAAKSFDNSFNGKKKCSKILVLAPVKIVLQNVGFDVTWY